MRPSTTIRIDLDTHDRIKVLADRMGLQMKETVRLAVDTLERRQFFDRLTAEVSQAGEPGAAELRSESDELTVSDGLD
jgi:phage terminase large subunit-like protein